MNRGDDDLVAFAERVLALLDEGRFTATYKYAVLLGLIDLCLEKTQRDGSAPTTVTTHELAHKVVELYWPHTTMYAGAREVLRQNRKGQATILNDVLRFRASLPDPSVPLVQARLHGREAFARLVRKVEWVLVKMPLPRLQVTGAGHQPLLYRIHWDTSIEQRKGAFNAYLRGEGEFDNRIVFVDHATEGLVRLNGLLRPLVQRDWAAQVAEINRLEAAQLEEFLFGASRIPLDAVRADLSELQSGLCFYCDGRLRGKNHVDHFIPWSRIPDNGIENLVVAHDLCNGAKRDFIAAPGHLARWARRNRESASMLVEIARTCEWESAPERAFGIATGIYTRIADGTRLWRAGQEFEPASALEIRAALDTGLA